MIAGRLRLPVVLLLLALLTPLFGGTALATRPFVSTESAVALPRSGARLEMGQAYENWNRGDRIYSWLTEFSYSFYGNLDLEVEVPWNVVGGGPGPDQFSDGLGDLRAKAKINFVKGRAANPLALSGQFSVKFPTGSGVTTSDEVDVRLAGLASKGFGPALVHANLSYTFVGDNGALNINDAWGIALGTLVETRIDGLSAVGEFFWDQARLAGEESRLEMMGGGVLQLTPRLKLDAVIRIGLKPGAPPSDGAPDYSLGVGFSYDIPQL